MPIEFLECWIEKALRLGLARTSWWMSGGHHGCRWGVKRPGLGISIPSSRPNPENSCYIWAFIIPTLRNPEMMSSHRIPQIHTSLSKTTLHVSRRDAWELRTIQCPSADPSQCALGIFGWAQSPQEPLLQTWSQFLKANCCLFDWFVDCTAADLHTARGGVTPWHSRGIIRGKPARMRHLAELSETLSISGTWNTHGPQRHQGVTLACPQCP